MADMTSIIKRLTDRIECDLLTYSPTSPPSVRPGPRRHLFPTGPHALKLCRPGDEVHLVCIADNSSNVFWGYIAEKLDRDDMPKSDCIISGPDHEATVWLHYCSIPPFFDLATVGSYGFPDYPESTYVPEAWRQNLTRLHDTWRLIDRLGSNLDAFRHDYSTLRDWAYAAGVFSERFGTLDAESLFWMLFNANAAPAQSSIDRRSPLSGGVQSFVRHYKLDNIGTVSDCAVYDAPSHIAINSFATIGAEINLLFQHPDSISFSTEQHYQRFCNSFQIILLVSAESWATDRQREAFDFHLTNKINYLPQHLRAFGIEPQGILRVWPHAFKPSEGEWLYAIGFNRLQPKIHSSIPGTFPNREPALQSFVSNFHFDLDGALGIATLSICSTEEALAIPGSHVVPGSSPMEPRRISPSPTTSLSASDKKFPPASHVMARLQWDPAHKPFQYELGYMDRFIGLMWLPLEQWGWQTEDEEFIPEHRIRIFRRIGRDGVRSVVWDREARVCSL